MVLYEAGFIGCGNMGGALARAAAKAVGGENVAAADHHPEKLEPLVALGAIPRKSAAAVAEHSRFLFLGVKPQALPALAEEIRDTLSARALRGDGLTVVSMAAGVTARTVSDLLGGVSVIRIMPNTPAEVGEGVILWYAGEEVPEAARTAFQNLLRMAGQLYELPERLFDAASALTGCGPAFACLFLEALTDGGVRCGLPRDLAAAFAQRTVLGTAKLALETGRDPAVLRGAVCSPAGSTIEGIAVLEEQAVRSAVLEAVTAAYRRTRKLGQARRSRDGEQRNAGKAEKR